MQFLALLMLKVRSVAEGDLRSISSLLLPAEMLKSVAAAGHRRSRTMLPRSLAKIVVGLRRIQSLRIAKIRTRVEVTLKLLHASRRDQARRKAASNGAAGGQKSKEAGRSRDQKRSEAV